MTATEGALEAHLAAWLAADFDLRCSDAVPVEGGVDRRAQLWRVLDDAGRSFAVKWTSGGSAAGLAVARTLADWDIDGVVAPLATNHGRLWSDRDGHRLVVLPWMEAPGALDAGMSERHWVAFGRLLAAVHATPIAAAPTLPASDRSHQRMRDAVAALHRAIEVAKDAGAETSRHDDLVGFVLDQAPLLVEIVDVLLAGADHLHAVAAGRGHAPPTVICHADAHLGNVLADDDARVWLLDWDDAVIGPAEQDLLFVLDGGVLGFAPVTAAQREAFFAGYGPIVPDPRALAYHRSLRALEDLVGFALEVLAPDRHPPTTRAAACGYLRGNLTAGGLTEAALRSLRDTGMLTVAPTLPSGNG